MELGRDIGRKYIRESTQAAAKYHEVIEGRAYGGSGVCAKGAVKPIASSPYHYKRKQRSVEEDDRENGAPLLTIHI